jgi:lipoprotein-anchoring transpeptidase ErfK/SrfK
MSLNRRHFLAAGALVAGGAVTGRALAGPLVKEVRTATGDGQYFDGTVEDNGFAYRKTNMSKIDPKLRRQLVHYQHNEPPGTIVVDSKNHFLYVAFENNTALRYGVGVGKEGFQWYGRAQVDRKQLWPEWVPPPEMLKRRPELPRHMDGGPDNPLGPRAMYLYRDGKDLGYRLHGTTEPWSIGGDVSSGCIRLLPEDVIDLYQRTPTGTGVLVLERLV